MSEIDDLFFICREGKWCNQLGFQAPELHKTLLTYLCINRALQNQQAKSIGGFLLHKPG